ncbi:MAG: DUF342 domain-containing protein [Proteobacteria bacterium]|nr:DUF342 domain-containing protein [Pseudomonadota bacterium]
MINEPLHPDVPALARVALEHKILTEDQVYHAVSQIAEEKRKGNILSMEDYLLEKNLVTKDTMIKLVAATVRHLDKQFGFLAVQLGFVDKESIIKALGVQKQAFANGTLVHVGDILIKGGLLSISQRDDLLKKIPSFYPETLPSDHFTPKPQEDPHDDKPSDSSQNMEQSLSLNITDNDQKAVLYIPGGLEEKPTLQQVKELINDHGIVSGILEDSVIEINLAKSCIEPYSFTIARGLPGSPPRGAVVNLYFENEYLNPGKITEDGAIDFRERGAVPFVKAGDLLAEKLPGVDGKAGITLFGMPIPAVKAEDKVLKSGSGTQASEDGLKIFAAINGQPFMTVHGEVSVFKELHISGDVDYTTGNITFDGSIFVKGSVKQGFTVKGGNLTAKDITGATIELKGNLEVSAGITDSVITLGGSIQAMFMTGSKVDSYGDVLIKKEIIDSKIRTSGACNGEQVNLISSFVSAKKGIDVKRVGTDLSAPCTLRVGVGDHANKIMKTLKITIEEKKAHLIQKQKKTEELKDIQQNIHQQIMEKAITEDRMGKQQAAINSKIQEVSQEAPRNPEEAKLIVRLKEALDRIISEIESINDQNAKLFSEQDILTKDILLYQSQCESLVMDIENLNGKVRDILSWDKKSGTLALIRTSKEIYAQTSVTGPNSTLILKDTHKNISIREIRHSDPARPSYEMTIESN